jgi:hypothetical protein
MSVRIGGRSNAAFSGRCNFAPNYILRIHNPTDSRNAALPTELCRYADFHSPGFFRGLRRQFDLPIGSPPPSGGAQLGIGLDQKKRGSNFRTKNLHFAVRTDAATLSRK